MATWLWVCVDFPFQKINKTLKICFGCATIRNSSSLVQQLVTMCGKLVLAPFFFLLSLSFCLSNSCKLIWVTDERHARECLPILCNVTHTISISFSDWLFLLVHVFVCMIIYLEQCYLIPRTEDYKGEKIKLM